MLKHLPLIGFAVGLVALTVESWSVRFVWRTTSLQPTTPRRVTRFVLLITGAALIVPVMGIKYSLDARTRVFGFPFMSFVFQKRGAFWEDYIGPLTVPALIANAVVSLLLPFAFWAFYLRFFRRIG